MTTTASSQKIHLTILFVIGMMYALFFSALDSAIDVMYNNEPETTNFLSFFRGVGALLAFTGLFISMKSTRGWLATTSIILLLAGAVLAILTGHIFSYDTRTNEYLLYFISTTAATLLFILAFTVVVKYLFARAGGEVIKFVLTGTAGGAIGYLVNFSFSLVASPAISLWYLIFLLLLILTYCFQKENPVEMQLR